MSAKQPKPNENKKDKNGHYPELGGEQDWVAAICPSPVEEATTEM